MTPQSRRRIFAFSCLLFLSLIQQLCIADIRLPGELVNQVGEEIDFKIPTDGESAIYGVNHLPPGLVLDATTGVVSGTLLKTGEFKVRFHELTTDSDRIESSLVDWYVVEQGEISDFQVFSRVLETEVNEDLSRFEAILNSLYSVTLVGDLPEGITFDIELNRFVGSLESAGVYEIDFEQKAGPTTWFTKVVFVAKDTSNTNRLDLPFSQPFSGMKFFNGTYYWPALEGLQMATDVLGTWTPASFQANGFIYDLEVFEDKLIVGETGGVWISNDGVQFEFISVPDIEFVERVLPGPEGVFLECHAFNQVRLYYSSDAENWEFIEYPAQTIANFSPTELNRIVVVEDEFHVAENSDFLVSKNGSSWTRVTPQGLQVPLPHTGIQYGNDTFAFLSGDGAYFGKGLNDWTFTGLPPGFVWLSIHFHQDRFFAIGRDASFSRSAHVLYSSKNGETFVPVELPDGFHRIHSIALINGLLFLEERWPNESSNGVLVTGESQGASVFFPGVIPFIEHVPAYIPLESSGEFSSIKAYGLPLGVSLDETKAILTGIPGPRIFGIREYVLITETEGVPGVVSRGEYGITNRIDEIPTFFKSNLFGLVGELIQNERLFLEPWTGPNDATDEIILSGQPDWLSFDDEEHEFVGTPPGPTISSFTAMGKNLYGETSKEIQLIISPTLFDPQPYIVNDNYSSENFVEGGGLVFSISRNGLFWSPDLVNWNPTTPSLRPTNDVVFFNERYFLYDQPQLYSSGDGNSWFVLETNGLENGILDQSLFAAGDRIYAVSGDQLVSSLNGEAWEAVGGNKPEGTLVRYVGEHFFAFIWGSNSPVYRSSDGVSWEMVANTDSTLQILDIEYGNGVYLIATENFEETNYVLRSADATNWTAISLPLNERLDLRPMTFGMGKFHLVTSRAGYMSSIDGLVWQSYTYPYSNQVPHIDFISFVGGKLLTGGSFGNWHEVRDIPPTVDMPNSANFRLGEAINIPIEVSGEATHFTVTGLPPGLSASASFGRIFGTPEQTGSFQVTIVAHNGSTFSIPAAYWINIYEGNPKAVLKDGPLFYNSGLNLFQLVDLPANYSGQWSFQSSNAPEGMVFDGLNIFGDVNPGVFNFDLQLLEDSDTLIDSKSLTLYSSEQIFSSFGYQFFKLYAQVGVPVSESFLYEAQGLVTDIGGLPDGLSFNSASKQLEGTPVKAGTFVLEVSFQNMPGKWYVSLSVEEDFGVLEEPVGSFDAASQQSKFEVVLENLDGVDFQWFYEGIALQESDGITGTDSSTLFINDLGEYDPQELSVELKKGDQATVLEADYSVSSSDFDQWAARLGLNGEQASPIADGLGTGYPNLFAFMQGAEDARSFQHPVLSRTESFVQIQLHAQKIWKQESLKILVSNNLGEELVMLAPNLISETEQFFLWEWKFLEEPMQSTFIYFSANLED